MQLKMCMELLCIGMHLFEWSSFSFVFYQHGGEGRLCEKFGSTMQHVASDDVR